MNRPSLALRAVGLLLAGLTSACGAAPPPSAIDRLKPCTVDEGPTDAYCGTYTVFENRDTRQGRQINLRIVVLPALSASSNT